MKVVLLGLVACAVLVVSPSRAGVSPCPALADAATLPLRPDAGGVLRGDVDADGRSDRVSVRYAPQAAASCGFLLVVQTGMRALAIRVPTAYKPPETIRTRDWSWPEPFVAALVRLDARGLQVVVAQEHGATIRVVTLYGLVGGKLRELRFEPDRYGNRLNLFGGAGTGVTDAVCARGGPLVLVSSWPDHRDWTPWYASRSVYRLSRDGVFVRSRQTTTTGSLERISEITHRWGANGFQFAGCTVARGRSLNH